MELCSLGYPRNASTKCISSANSSQPSAHPVTFMALSCFHPIQLFLYPFRAISSMILSQMLRRNMPDKFPAGAEFDVTPVALCLLILVLSH